MSILYQLSRRQALPVMNLDDSDSDIGLTLSIDTKFPKRSAATMQKAQAWQWLALSFENVRIGKMSITFRHPIARRPGRRAKRESPLSLSTATHQRALMMMSAP